MSDLGLVEAFLNTADERTFRHHGTAHTGGDTLHRWLEEHGLPPDQTLDTATRLRAALRHSLTTDLPGTPSVLAEFPLHLTMSGRLTLGAEDTGLGRIVEAVARAVVNGSWSRMKLCAADDCRWAFYDTSKSGGGRWCAMNVCGNRAKTRAYRRRLGPGTGAPGPGRG